MNQQPTDPDASLSKSSPYLKSTAVMKLLGYKDRGAFWDFVYRGGVPHIRLNARRIMFDERTLSAWLTRRSTGTR